MSDRITVRVRRAGGRDRFGDPKPPTEHTIASCLTWPRASSETSDSSDTVIVGRELSVPDGANLQATDEVLLPGEDQNGPWWTIEGGVEFWGPHPRTGVRRGAVVALQRVTG